MSTVADIMDELQDRIPKERIGSLFPASEAFSVWTTKSVATLSLIGNVLQWLKKKATLSPNNTDDKIITYLVNFFSLEWFKNVSGKNNER